MAAFEKFNFKTYDDLRAKIDALGVSIETTEDFSPLAQPLTIGNVTAPNRMAVLPMEGCDSEEDGTPSELVFRRYRRFASCGAGLLWFEACAVVQEGRANRLQMYLRKDNLDVFKQLVKETHAAALENHAQRPVCILQLTHSGRYSKPEGVPAPLIAYNNPIFEKDTPIDPSRIVTDE